MAENVGSTGRSIYFHQVTDKHLDKNSLVDAYDKWAPEYEKELETFGDNRFKCFIDASKDLIGDDKNVKILDAGAGPGNGGKALFEMGYKNIDALDASPGMLELAKSKNVYQRVICAFLGPDRLDIEEDTYDVIFCLGALLVTHINDAAFEEMIRITKPGGYIVFSIGKTAMGDDRGQLEVAMQRVHDEGKWEWCIRRTMEGYFGKLASFNEAYFYAFKIPSKKCDD